MIIYRTWTLFSDCTHWCDSVEIGCKSINACLSVRNCALSYAYSKIQNAVFHYLHRLISKIPYHIWSDKQAGFPSWLCM